MIYAKTRLNKLPKTCKECKFSIVAYERLGTIDLYDGRICILSGNRACQTEKTPNGNTKYTKPVWCPLMEVKE